MAGNFTNVDIKPKEALCALQNLMISLKNMMILNDDIINEYSLLKNAIMDDGLDLILTELNKAKILIEQSIEETDSIASIVFEYIFYIEQAYGKTNY